MISEVYVSRQSRDTFVSRAACKIRAGEQAPEKWQFWGRWLLDFGSFTSQNEAVAATGLQAAKI